jgi:hypothetical protein
VTTASIVRALHGLEYHSAQAKSWIEPGGVCCLGPRAYGYCTAKGCTDRAIHAAYVHATLAASAARMLFPRLLKSAKERS